MIPKQENVKVFSNSKNEKAFTINASREAFRILSSGLYSNKPQAIVRELSCNAYDAHVMAGCPERPFKVHLPDSWEPFLSIEDFGIGLDDDDVNNIYTTYFASTKTHSNDVIGGLGLGSKTPFSYTDTFTIRTRKDSVERIYNAYISDAGSPTVSLVSESDTDEPNGTLITVPIRSDDFNIFESEAERVFQYFKVLPEINFGDLNNNIVNELDDANGLIINSNAYNSGNVTAIMGNVGYSVKVTDSIVPRDKTRAWSFLAKSSLVIRFDIGDLSVAASRETISFDDETKEVFVNKLENIVGDYYNQFQEDIDRTCNSKSEALTYVERKLGEWAWGILEFNGENIFTIASENLVPKIVEIIDPVGDQDGTITMLEKRYNYSDALNKVVLNSKHNEHRMTFKGFRAKKISFIMDDTDHHRGFDTNSRSFIRSRSTQLLVQVPFVLTDDQQQELHDYLGENLTEFVTLTEVKEMFKVVREKQAGPKAERKTPVDRAKKNEIRIDYWRNNDPRAVTHFDEYVANGLLDIDELSSKRVAIAQVSRGCFEPSVFGRVDRTLSVYELIFLSKIFNLDYIIIVRPSQFERVKEKMPFSVNLHELGTGDVVNNDVLFLNSCLYQLGLCAWELKKLSSQSKLYETIDNLAFNDMYKDYKYRNDDVVKMCKSIGVLDIPEIEDSTEIKILTDKLVSCLDNFTDAELKSLNNYSKPRHDCVHKKIYLNYLKDVSAKMYERTKVIIEKYPLLVYMDIYESRLDQINHYINMVNVMPHPSVVLNEDEVKVSDDEEEELDLSDLDLDEVA